VKVTGTLDAPAANPFDQDLNTGNSVRFYDVAATNTITPYVHRTGGVGTASRMWQYSNIENMYGSYLTLTTQLYTDTIGNASNTPMTIRTYNSGSQPLALQAYEIIPWSHNSQRLGSSARVFSETWTTTAYAKQPGLIPGCERSLSGQEWQQQIQSEETALETLTYEVTKTLQHITYSDTDEHEIICTCGKSVVVPCFEHKEEWNEKYCKNLARIYETTAYLSLEHAAHLVELHTKLEQTIEELDALKKQNRQFEQKIATLEQKLLQ
jgi:hypothetical protein